MPATMNPFLKALRSRSPVPGGAPGAGWDESGMNRQWEQAGNAARDYDPTAAITTAANAQWGNYREGMADDLEHFRADSNAGGRLNTGYFDEGTGQIWRDTMNRFGRDVAGLSVEGERLKADRQNQYLDILSSRREEVINARREKEEAKRRRRRGIGGLIGGVIGAAAGSIIPGIGTKIGWGVGSQVGSGGY